MFLPLLLGRKCLYVLIGFDKRLADEFGIWKCLLDIADRLPVEFLFLFVLNFSGG